MTTESNEHIAALQQAIRTHADPRVRHRAQGVLLVCEGHSISEVARLFHTAAHCVRTWRDRFLADGVDGLADRSRRGRPPKLDADARQFLATTLEQPPGDFGLPMTVWSIRDLQALLLRERQLQVSVYTIHRTVQSLGFRYRRPRHDLTHRQDKDAVASAKQVLAWLEKKALLQPSDAVWSLWMSVKSTPIQGWQKSGNDGASQ
jgi:transposase